MQTRERRWGAASGYLVLLCAAGAVALERSTPAGGLPDAAAVAEFVTTYRSELLAQSVLFVLSTGFLLVFVAALRGHLGGRGLLADVAFGAGVVAAALQLAAQAAQVALGTAARAGLDPGPAALLYDLGLALFTVANLPVAALLAAVAVAALRAAAFPPWLGWLSAATAAVHLLPVAGVTVAAGPLVQAGWVAALGYALYALWLAATASALLFRSPAPRVPTAARREGGS